MHLFIYSFVAPQVLLLCSVSAFIGKPKKGGFGLPKKAFGAPKLPDLSNLRKIPDLSKLSGNFKPKLPDFSKLNAQKLKSSGLKNLNLPKPSVPDHIKQALRKLQDNPPKIPTGGFPFGKPSSGKPFGSKPFGRGFKLPSFQPKIPKVDFGKWATTFKKMVEEGKKNFATADINNDDRVDLEELIGFIQANLPRYQEKHLEEFKNAGGGIRSTYFVVSTVHYCRL